MQPQIGQTWIWDRHGQISHWEIIEIDRPFDIKCKIKKGDETFKKGWIRYLSMNFHNRPGFSLLRIPQVKEEYV